MAKTVSIREVDAGMFSDVLPLLEDFDPTVESAAWQRLFEPGWEQQGHCGFGLFDGSRVVGFLGVLFSTRTIRGRDWPICNLATWAVLPEYREHSLRLLMRVLKSARS